MRTRIWTWSLAVLRARAFTLILAVLLAGVVAMPSIRYAAGGIAMRSAAEAARVAFDYGSTLLRWCPRIDLLGVLILLMATHYGWVGYFEVKHLARHLWRSCKTLKAKLHALFWIGEEFTLRFAVPVIFCIIIYNPFGQHGHSHHAMIMPEITITATSGV